MPGLHYLAAEAIPPETGDLFELTSSPEGGWAEPQRSKALYYGGHTYIGYVAGGTVGDVTILEINNSTMAQTSHVLNSTLTGEGSFADMHSNPALLVRDSDHRLLAAYCDHADSTIRLRVSTNTLDADPTLSGGFASEHSLDAELGTSTYDYPTLLQLTGVAGDPIYLFFRSSASGTSRWLYSVNTDAAVSGDDASNGWSVNQWLYRNTSFEPYMQITSNGVDRIDFIGQNKNEGEANPNELRHGYFEGGTFYKSDGTSIGTHPLTNPLTPSDLTLAASGAAFHQSHCLERDDVTGDIAFTLSGNDAGTDKIYRVMWDGAAWAKDEIATSSGKDSWGNVIDPDDFDRALIVRASGGVDDLWDYSFSGSWSGSQLSPGGGSDWNWPVFVKDGVSGLRAMVLYGHYTTYTDSGFLFGIWGIAD